MLRERIEQVLESFRPRLRLDGADLVLLDVSPDGVLRIRVTGPHACCPMVLKTLESGIEDALAERIAEVKRVVAVK